MGVIKMLKILNKLLFTVKNILILISLSITIYIIVFMFQRLEKEIFGGSFIEFLLSVLPFFLLMILSIVNMTFKQHQVTDNIFYNITSFLVLSVIMIFCLRALFDQGMYFWHKYPHNINYSYFSDQLSAIKVMLYGLSLSNIIFMVTNYLNE